MLGNFLSTFLVYLVVLVIAVILLALFLVRSNGFGRRPGAHTRELQRRLFSREREE